MVELTPAMLDELEKAARTGRRHAGDAVTVPCGELAALVRAARERQILGVAARDAAYWIEQVPISADVAASRGPESERWARLIVAGAALKLLAGPAGPAERPGLVAEVPQ